ncbi:MAG: methylmalonyl Co-A mutase-associated GTPase MeaB [Corynebacteriales bacterium]|nr:methylmalonyl Co-A mutase-associated GTPase MeaB [Mycobacteriales bacterium]
MRELNVSATVEAARAGRPRAVARLISAVENDSPQLREITTALNERPGSAHVIGLTGSPGVGKSTCTAALVAAFRAQGKRVGVLAVDPSSPFSGGALLGDRVRMQQLATDDQVYIRSLATRGHLGGLSLAVPAALRVLSASGCDVVLIETVGVGQAELEIAGLADTTLLLMAPGMGDGIQAAKAGIVEIADIFVVNKADRDGADATVRDVKNMLALGGAHSSAGSWRPMIVKTVASAADPRVETGIDELMTAIDKHQGWLSSHDQLRERRLARARAEIESIVLSGVRARLAADASLPALSAAVISGELSPYVAADRWVEASG